MTSNKAILLIAGCVVLAGCGVKPMPISDGTSSGSSTFTCSTTNGSAPSSLVVNGSSISSPGGASQAIYFQPQNNDMAANVNVPFVTLTICPGSPYNSSNCATVPNILLDTGSYGLRVFKSALLEYKPTISIPSSTTGDCVLFGSGATWGGVVPAFVTLGGQRTTSAVQMQVISSSFGNSSVCDPGHPQALLTSPSTAGFNGILGVGTLISECVDGQEGYICAHGGPGDPGGGVYFSCPSGWSGGSCSAADVAQTSQVRNPVTYLPAGYNNGVIVELPAVAANGSAGNAVTGYVVFGIPTISNPHLLAYDTDVLAEFSTNFTGLSFTSFLDSGSNGIFLPDAVAGFTLDSNGFALPSSTASCSGITIASSNGSQGYIAFQVANAGQLLSGANMVFNNLAGNGGSLFDWGIPFFLGRNIYVGIDGATATINGATITGPYWAY